MLGYIPTTPHPLPPRTEFLTHACENITLPQLLLWAVILIGLSDIHITATRKLWVTVCISGAYITPNVRVVPSQYGLQVRMTNVFLNLSASQKPRCFELELIAKKFHINGFYTLKQLYLFLFYVGEKEPKKIDVFEAKNLMCPHTFYEVMSAFFGKVH